MNLSEFRVTSSEFEKYLEEHLQIFRQKQKSTFRTHVGKSLTCSTKMKDVSIARIIQTDKINQKLLINRPKKKKIRCYWMDLPNLNTLFDFLFEHAMTDDIFRKPGRKIRTDDLEEKIDNDHPIDWSEVRVFDAADLLKRYFRSLKTPLIPEENQKYHRQLAVIMSDHGLDEEDFILNLQALFVCLPHWNRQMAIKLFLLLKHTVSVQSNPEASKALATIFLPCLLPILTPPELRLDTYQSHVKFIIDNWNIISNPPPLVVQELHQMCPNCSLICPYYKRDTNANIRDSPLSNIRRRYRRWRKKPQHTIDHEYQYRSTLPREPGLEKQACFRRSNSFGGSSSTMPRI